jgi:5'-3' exonuclease
VQIVDGGMMAFAAYHALKDKVRYPLAYQMPLMLHRIINESADLLVVCWDGESLWKREAWPQYRQRPEIWEEASAFDFDSMFRLLNAMGVVQFRAPGIEADEFIAALVHVFDGDVPLLIRSDDKDFMQLLSETTWMHGRVRGVVRPEDVPRILNVAVDQVVDLLTLTGDKIDGVPEIASEAESLRIIHHCGHVKDWLHARSPPQEVRRLLDRSRDQLEMNLRLVDLSDEALDLVVRPDIEGFGDAAAGRKLRKELGLDHLSEELLEDVLATGVESMTCLLESGLVE